MSTNHSLLTIENLHARIESLPILKGFNITIKPGEIHAIMGPNGSGKSTLSKVMMGHPAYTVTDGEITFKGQHILEKTPDERARLGIFMAFQQPREVAGITLSNFLRAAQKQVYKEKNSKLPSIFDFKKNLKNTMSQLKMSDKFTDRFINQGFSGGEKKKTEIVQMKILNPELVILDEIDSGLDVDALRAVAKALQEFISPALRNSSTDVGECSTGPAKGILIITHYQRILQHIKPDVVHVMIDGRILQSGGHEFAQALEEEGYEQFLSKSRNEALPRSYISLPLNPKP